MTSTHSSPAAVRTNAGSGGVGWCEQDFAEAALVAAGDAHVLGAFVGRRFQQPGVLEADVGEFPQQVIEQHEPSRGRHHRIVRIDPQDVVGGARGWAWTGPDPDRRDTPCGGAPHCVDDHRLVRGGDREQQVTGLAGDPGLRHRVGLDERDGGQRALAHDHGVYEFDCDVVGVRFPLG